MNTAKQLHEWIGKAALYGLDLSAVGAKLRLDMPDGRAVIVEVRTDDVKVTEQDANGGTISTVYVNRNPVSIGASVITQESVAVWVKRLIREGWLLRARVTLFPVFTAMQPEPPTPAPAVVAVAGELPTQEVKGNISGIWPEGSAMLADKLDKLAEAMQPAIDDKRRPRETNTARKARIAEGIRQDAEALELVQAGLRALASAWRSGTVPPLLEGITSRALVEDIFHKERGDYLTEAGEHRLEKAGLRGLINDANTTLKALISAQYTLPVRDDKAEMIRALETEARFARIPGFFPTPEDVVDLMLEKADLEPGMRVLEPSAGNGNIADAVVAAGAQADVIEINPTLTRILDLKGHTIVGSDFNEWKPEAEYDRAIMNPPFERGQDIDHVRKAHQIVRPGGKVVAIMSSGAFFRADKKATAFRDWLDTMDHEVEVLPEGAFKESGTGVRANLVVIEKEAA